MSAQRNSHRARLLLRAHRAQQPTQRAPQTNSSSPLTSSTPTWNRCQIFWSVYANASPPRKVLTKRWKPPHTAQRIWPWTEDESPPTKSHTNSDAISVTASEDEIQVLLDGENGGGGAHAHNMYTTTWRRWGLWSTLKGVDCHLPEWG